MVMSLIVIAVVLGVGYLWVTRGFFSAFLHAVCTLVAGAVAFAAWEPLSYWLLGVLPSTGGLRFLHGLSWAIGLVVPFAVAVVVLRVISDTVVKGNLTLAKPVEYGGAAVFGLISAVISVGIGVIALGHARVSMNFAGYKPLQYNEDRQNAAGSLTFGAKLWLPADAIVEWLYSGMSQRAFATSTPLAQSYPNLRVVGYAGRISAEEGQGRNTLKPGDARVTGRFTVGDPAGGTRAADLLRDSVGPQAYRDINGAAVEAGRIEGFVVRFEPGAKEDAARGAGQVQVSNGQVRLLARDAAGESIDIFPLAVISQAGTEERRFGRWRFEAAGDVVASVGGGSTVDMAFEFLVPRGFEPVSLHVKNVRLNVADMGKAVAIADTAARDAAVANNGAILSGGGGGAGASGGGSAGGASGSAAVHIADAVKVDPTAENNATGIQASAALGRVVHAAMIGRFFQVVKEDNAIISGRGTYGLDEFRGEVPREKSLRADRFSMGSGQAMVQVKAGPEFPAALTGPVISQQPGSAPMRLIDTDGTVYDAVGYIYEDREKVEIRFTPADPLGGTEDLPAISRSRDDQKLTVLFIVSTGVTIDRLTVGEKVILKLEPGLKTR